MSEPSLKSEDILLLLKMAVWNTHSWSPEVMSGELGPTPAEIQSSLHRLHRSGLIHESHERIKSENFKEFILYGIQYIFPTQPGKICRGILTGAKSESFFKVGLPHSSLLVWPNDDGKEHGYEVEPVSPHCCFAALNDSKLKSLLAITETMRIAGSIARPWANEEMKKIVNVF